jgi:hypothetical protein
MMPICLGSARSGLVALSLLLRMRRNLLWEGGGLLVCSCSWCGIVCLLFFSTLGLGRLLFKFCIFSVACMHTYIARRESSSRETTRYQGRLTPGGIGSVCCIVIVILRHFAVWLLRRIHTYFILYCFNWHGGMRGGHD